MNSIRINFPNLEELLFLTVWAFPNASKIGLARSICCDKLEKGFPVDRDPDDSGVATAAKYWMTFFVFSVFPAPDSPLKLMLLPQRKKLSKGEIVRHKYTLILSFFHEVAKSLVCHCKYMWPCVFSALALVHLHVFVCVNWEGTIWVDGN